MTSNNGDEPSHEGGALGRLIVKLTVIVGLVGALGAAIDGAINNWSFVGRAMSTVSQMLGPDCEDFSKLSTMEIEECLEQQD